MFTIRKRFQDCLESVAEKEYIGINYAVDALETYKAIFPNKDVSYVDADMYSPLLYKFWGEYLLKNNIISQYEIIVRNYRYVISVTYGVDNKTVILGSDSLLSVGKSNVSDIGKHRYIGGFALWPSYRGGINFRKNRYKDDIFKTLEDISRFYELGEKEYKGVITPRDYAWFNYLGKDFFTIFSFDDYHKYAGKLEELESNRTNIMNEKLRLID